MGTFSLQLVFLPYSPTIRPLTPEFETTPVLHFIFPSAPAAEFQSCSRLFLSLTAIKAVQPRRRRGYESCPPSTSDTPDPTPRARVAYKDGERRDITTSRRDIKSEMKQRQRRPRRRRWVEVGGGGVIGSAR